ncbi:MAG TPA: hypothetical protein VEU33_43570, partial [Archangium sp.]|nr:hypothetical protein [Archangium sp.]
SMVMGMSMAALSGCGANEPQSAEKIQMQPAKAGVKANVTEFTAPIRSGFNLEQMSVLLDGTVRSMASLSEIQGQLSIIVDDEGLKTGMARAYRTTEEFDAYVEKQDKDCTTSGVSAMDTTSQCVFYDSLNCGGSWTRRIVSNCGERWMGVANFMTVRSFALGCGFTYVCPSTDCSSGCAAAMGPAGTCYNMSGGAVQCVGCMN